MESSRRIAALCGATISISACVDLSSPTQHALFLTCEPLTRNARGDIDPIPSPDGQYVAYRRMTAASPELGELHYLRLDDPLKSNVLLKAGGFHGGASWSPDSEWLSYTVMESREPVSAFVGNSVYKVNVRTNEKIRLVDTRTIPQIGEYTSWTERNEIYFATPDAFYVIDPQGGTPRKKLVIDTNLQDAPIHLAAEPRGKSIAFSVDTHDSDDTVLRRRSGIWLANLIAGQILQLTHDSPDSFPVWQGAGKILFLRASNRKGEYSLHSLELSTGRITSIGTQEIVYSISTIPDQAGLFAATADRWDMSGNGFNFFRGFSIARCR